MLVGERMSKPVVTVPPEMPISEALNLLKKEKIRRAPVIRDGKMIGIVSDIDLLNASPSPVTTLSIWEMNYLLSKITVSEVMTKNVLSITEDTPLEQAARVMADNGVGGLPVLRDGRVVGIVTETDLFKVFLELLGARETGVRVTALIQDEPGQLAKITEAIASQKGNFVAFGQFTGEDPTNKTITFKVKGLTQEELKKAIDPFVKEILDIRS